MTDTDRARNYSPSSFPSGFFLGQHEAGICELISSTCTQLLTQRNSRDPT